MLTVIPRGWFSWNFRMRQPEGQDVGELQLSSWRERGSVMVDGLTYTILRDGLMGPFLMKAPDDSVVATATKPSAFRQTFIVSYHQQVYELKAVSAFRRKFEIFTAQRLLGSITPRSSLGRTADLQFTAAAPPMVLQAFLTWLTLLLWKRASDGAAAAG